MHGNLLTSLPESIGDLSALKALSAVGNQITALPQSIGNLQSLTSLELAGNKLEQLPETIGNLGERAHVINHQSGMLPAYWTWPGTIRARW